MTSKLLPMLCVPTHIYISKKKRIPVNLNWYRNAHHMSLNKAKVVYKEHVLGALSDVGVAPNSIKLTPPLMFVYTLYPPTRHLTDVGNVLSIVQKFTEDALVELGFIEDDNYEFIRGNFQKFGYVDRARPRVEVEIYAYGGASKDTDSQLGFIFAT